MYAGVRLPRDPPARSAPTTTPSQNSVCDALVVVVLSRAPVVDGGVYQLVDLLDAAVVGHSPKEPLLQLGDDLCA